LYFSRRYLHAYQSLTDWVYSSLDIYKNEVIQVLYPVFVHCYLELVLKGFKEEARKFLNKYKSHHTHFHYEELLTLQSLISSDIIAQNEFAQRVLHNKFVIRLSQASFDLLMKFLQDSELNLLAILNRFVNFKVYKGQPSITAPAIVDGVLELDTGKRRGRRDKRKRDESADSDDEDSGDVLSTNRKPIHWETAVANIEAARSGEKVPGKRGRKKKSVVEAEKQMKALAESASKSAPTFPSSCFYTLFNCQGELNTMAIGVPRTKRSSTSYDFEQGVFDTTNGPIVAAGYSDSTIKCWNWNLVANRNSLSVNNDLMDIEEEVANGGYLGSKVKKPQNVEYQTLVGHCGPVFSLSFSADQRWLLSSSEDGTARLWNVETGTNIVVYKGHQYAVWDVSFSPIDYLFATASHDRTARIWMTDRVTPVRILAGHLSDVECVKFHPNSKYVATGSSDKTVRLWDTGTGECVRLFRGHYGAVHCLAFSRDGRYCASAGQDEQVLVWDIASGRQLYRFKGHTDQISSLDFNHSGSLLASSSMDSTIRLWDLVKEESAVIQSTAVTVPDASAEKGTGVATGSAEKTPQQIAAESSKKIIDEDEGKRIYERKPVRTFYTKQTPVYTLKYLQKDVILAGGAFNLN
jgi:transcription initiation factor TFIID subunit 5